MAPITLILADDHPIVLHGLEELFRSERDVHVVAACRDGEQALAAVRAHRPDVLLLDLQLPVQDGLSVLRSLRSENLRTRTVLLSAFLVESAVVQAVRLGVAGIVLKDSTPSVLVECVRRVAAGGSWYDTNLAATTLQHALGPSGAGEAGTGLTRREMDIVRMVAEGLRNKDIAGQLGISEGTVKIHLHNIYTKLELDGRVDLVRYAQRLHLI